VAADFFTIEVWTKKGLQRFIVLFFIELSTRRVEIGGISAAANGLWMTQIARNLTDSVDGLLAGKRYYLIHDRAVPQSISPTCVADTISGPCTVRGSRESNGASEPIVFLGFDIGHFV
jgi:hypothetical protein